MTFWKWSRTAATNATADSTCPFPEGMNPGALNDGTRGMMAAAAKYRDDISGATLSTGSSSAYAVASFQGYDTLAHLDGALIAFTAHEGNANAATLNVDGLGAKPLRSAPGIDLPSNSLVMGTPYVATYYNTAGEWILQNGFANPYNVPVGGMIEWSFGAAPNSAFAMPYGQTLSRTTFDKLWTQAQIEIAAGSLLYNNGNGTTTFGIFDMRGRVSACPDNMGGSQAGRLNSGSMASVANILGGAGGAATSTLITANLPAYTPAGSIANGTITSLPVIDFNLGLPAYGGWRTASAAASAGGGTIPVPDTSGTSGLLGISSTQAASAFGGTPQGGSSAPTNVTQPTIIVPRILRII
ncbi:phage tail protein [Tardiphaga sp. P5_C7]